jgi:tetratricopeptide (TPR) repeat protein
MRWCLERWRGRAALLAILCAFAVPAVAGPDDGPKKSETTKPEEKNPLIEDAGQRLVERKFDEAYKLLQEASAKKPDLPPARLMLARLMMTIREYQPRVRQVLELAIQENPTHPLVYLDNAGFAMNEGRVTDAILNSEKALALAGAGTWTPEQKKDIETKAHAFMASGYEARADWEHARSQLTTLLAKDPKNPQYRFRLAQALFFTDPVKKEQDAIAELKQASNDDKAKAAGDEKALTLVSPDVAMAKFWAMKGENPNARKYFEQAVKVAPDKERVHIAYADWLMQLNDIPTAKLHVDAAAKIKPSDPEVQKFQGLIDRVQKNLPEAEKIFKQIIAVSPEDNYARNQLALVLADEPTDEAHRQAKAHAELFVQSTNQKSPEAWATLGYVQYKLKDVNTALQYLQEALKASNGQLSPDMGYYIALCWKDKDEIDKAKAIIKEALAAKGLFVYKREAEDLRDKLDKMPPKSSSSSNK